MPRRRRARRAKRHHATRKIVVHVKVTGAKGVCAPKRRKRRKHARKRLHARKTHRRTHKLPRRSKLTGHFLRGPARTVRRKKRKTSRRRKTHARRPRRLKRSRYTIRQLSA